ncbi:hypothetical protein MKEN_01156600 [Mycena kentingensis (nom. inval.)]|nr:hypothetical protein MKEN_01156600 [Mycena kentingensis (nom. inval.)]
MSYRTWSTFALDHDGPATPQTRPTHAPHTPMSGMGPGFRLEQQRRPPQHARPTPFNDHPQYPSNVEDYLPPSSSWSGQDWDVYSDHARMMPGPPPLSPPLSIAGYASASKPHSGAFDFDLVAQGHVAFEPSEPFSWMTTSYADPRSLYPCFEPFSSDYAHLLSTGSGTGSPLHTPPLSAAGSTFSPSPASASFLPTPSPTPTPGPGPYASLPLPPALSGSEQHILTPDTEGKPRKQPSACTNCRKLKTACHRPVDVDPVTGRAAERVSGDMRCVHCQRTNKLPAQCFTIESRRGKHLQKKSMLQYNARVGRGSKASSTSL